MTNHLLASRQFWISSHGNDIENLTHRRTSAFYYMPPSRTPQVLFQGMTSKKSFFPNSMMFIGGSQESQSSIYSFCTELLRFGRHVMKGLRAFVCAVAFSLPLARGQCYPVPTSNGLVYTCTSYSSQMGNPRFDMEPWNALERLVATGCV